MASTTVHAPPMPSPREGVEDLVLEKADDFLRGMGPTRDPWKEDPTAWIHRGQANAAWPLQARGVREADAFARCGIDGAISGWSERKQVLDLMLERFRRGLDASGLAIPTRSPRVLWRQETSSNAIPEREAFPLMALAQHHGLPTLLLDWTRRAAIAAYVAAADAAEPGRDDQLGTHLAVWSLRIGPGDDGTGDTLWWKHGVLQLYEAPGGTNPNLRAQSGLFTLIWGIDDPSVEQVLLRRRAEGLPAPVVLRRTMLPRSEAPRLLRLLSYEGVHGASMFPGADGVVRSMREEALWDVRKAPGRR